MDPKVVDVLDTSQVLDQLTDAVVVAGADGVIRYVNASAARMLGWERRELVGQPLTAIIPARLHADHLQGFARYQDTGAPNLIGGPAVLVPARRRDGAEVSIELTLAAQSAPDGRQLFVGSMRDVSDRIELERRLALTDYLQASLAVTGSLNAARSAEAGLRSVLPSLCTRLDWDVAGLWMRDRRQPRLRGVDVWSPHGGHDQTFAPWLQITTSMEVARGEGLPGQCWQSGEPILTSNVLEVLSSRRDVARALGLTSAVTFPLLSGRRVLGVVELLGLRARTFDAELPDLLMGIGRQLGQFLERMRVEDEVRLSESRYRSLVLATAMDVFQADPAGQLTTDMPHWRRFTGQTREQISGVGWLEGIDERDRAHASDTWHRATASAVPYEAEYRIVGRDGGRRVIAARATPLLSDGVVQEFIGVCTDITQQRAAESARGELADALQRALLPPRLPSPPGLDIAAAYRAGGDGLQVGGDFYDVVPVAGGVWDASIGDVCGKGPQAAAITGLARHTLRAAGIDSTSPARILRVLNEVMLHEDTARPFLTAVHARLRPEASGGCEVVLAVAGHPLPLLVGVDGVVRPVGVPGTLLGVLDELDLADIKLTVGPGECLALFTDGVVEARGRRGQFGEERLRAVLSEHRGEKASSIAAAVETEVMRFRDSTLADDLAVLIIRVPA